MQRVGIFIAALAAIVIGQLAAAQPAGQQRVTLNLVTAGDQNMVDYVKDYLGPMFEKEHPGVTVRAVGTGPGDAGSQKIYEKLEAQKNNSRNTQFEHHGRFRLSFISSEMLPAPSITMGEYLSDKR